VSYLQFNKEGTGHGFEGCMIQLFRYRNVLPRLHNNNCWRSGLAFNHIRFYDGLWIQLAPVLRSLPQHCIQVRLIGDDLACCFGSFPQNAGQYDDRFSGDLVVKSREYGVVASKALAWNLLLKRPDPLK